MEDADNPTAPQVYSKAGKGGLQTSTMAVEVQLQDTSRGLSGDLAWVTVGSPVRPRPRFSDTPTIEWGGLGGTREAPRGVVDLPEALTSAIKMRLRISEIDFLASSKALAKVDTSNRRSFVAFIPLN